MKICITGKGGSGKSMVSALLALSLAEKGHRVLVVDADESNMGLPRMLGVGEGKETLMDHLGGKLALKRRMRSSTESKSSILTEEDLPSAGRLPAYVSEFAGIRLLKIGKIEHSGEGCACPMGALTRDFLSELTPEEGEIVVVDLEAGIEHFGRGIESQAEGILVVVNPTFESMLLAEKIVGLGKDLGCRVLAVLNNVSPSEQEFLTASLQERGVSVAASIRQDPAVFEACLKGDPLTQMPAQQDVAGIVEALGL
jgi:CO dehydrogenase maturation factor